MKAANPEHLQEIPVLTNFIEEVSPQPSQLGGNVVHAVPSVSRPMPLLQIARLQRRLEQRESLEEGNLEEKTSRAKATTKWGMPPL